jgi:hypothetical protein
MTFAPSFFPQPHYEQYNWVLPSALGEIKRITLCEVITEGGLSQASAISASVGLGKATGSRTRSTHRRITELRLHERQRHAGARARIPLRLSELWRCRSLDRLYRGSLSPSCGIPGIRTDSAGHCRGAMMLIVARWLMLYQVKTSACLLQESSARNFGELDLYGK